MIFGRFTERAQNILYYAKQAAEEFRHGYIGTEHILLGLLKEDKGMSKSLLNDMNVNEENVKNLIAQYESFGEFELNQKEIPLTPRTKRLLEISLLEARNKGHNYITPEHMLLALIKKEDGLAYTILNDLGVNFEKLEAQLENDPNLKQGKQVSGEGNERVAHNTPTLDKYGRDLTKMAEEGKLDPVIGRGAETERVLEIDRKSTRLNSSHANIPYAVFCLK